jgi:ribose transport system permease protein
METTEASRLREPLFNWRRLLLARESSVVIVLVLLCVALIFSPARDTFYSRQNIQNMLLQIALLAIFSIGETLVIITAGIDLSLGSLIAFSGMVLAMTATHLPPTIAVPTAIVVALAVSLLIGAVHALLIGKLRLPAFVVTLASLTILRSQAQLMNGQLPVPISKYPFLINLANGQLFKGTFFAVPIPAVLLLVIAIAAHFILTRTRIGRYIYSLGGNEQATRLSGVNILGVLLFAYCASAFLGGVAGILYAGYGQQGDPQNGLGYELNAVAAAVIGGANLMGGEGSVIGTVLGACLLQMILSAINLTINNPTLWQGTVVGGVLLVAVLVTAIQQRKNRS